MDSNDRERIGEAREELMRMLAEDELRDAVLLIFANKQVSGSTGVRESISRHNLRTVAISTVRRTVFVSHGRQPFSERNKM